MADRIVTLKLNPQQLELLDRTVTQGYAPDRVDLIRLALREYSAKIERDNGSVIHQQGEMQ